MASGDHTGSDIGNHLIDEVTQQLPYVTVDVLHNHIDYGSVTENFSSFEDVYNNISKVLDEALSKCELPDGDKKTLHNKIKNILRESLDEIQKDLVAYAHTVRESKKLDAVSNEEVIIWFDDAYLIPPDSQGMHDIIKYIMFHIL